MDRWEGSGVNINKTVVAEKGFECGLIGKISATSIAWLPIILLTKVSRHRF